MEEVKKGEIVIYQAFDKKVKIDVKLDQDTVWLTQKQMSLLFNKNVKTISEHIKNIYAEKELGKTPTIWKSQIVQKEGGRTIKRNVDLYNLDVIISVGYRVKSLQGTKFRIWATRTLRDYLVRGYAINEKRLLEARGKFKELQTAIDLLQKKSGHELLAGQEQEILNLLSDYSKTLTLLEQYDKEKVPLAKAGRGKFVLDYSRASEVVESIKKDLIEKKEASELFGQDNSEKLKGIVGNIYQTFDKKELYPSIEEKAAHLLYFIIKDHPFVDGNKRTASFLFVYFLDKNNYLYKETGEKKINDNALVALALLIAISDMSEKDKLIKIITNLLTL
jgi:death-on-curing family protein